MVELQSTVLVRETVDRGHMVLCAPRYRTTSWTRRQWPYQVIHKKPGRVKCSAAVHLLIAEVTVALPNGSQKSQQGEMCGSAIHLLIAQATVALPRSSQNSWQGEMWRWCSPSDCWGDSGLNQVVHNKAGRVKSGAAVHLPIAEATVALPSGSQKSQQCEMWRCCSPYDFWGDSCLNKWFKKKLAVWNVAPVFTFLLLRRQWPYQNSSQNSWQSEMWRCCLIAQATVALPSGSQKSWQGEMWRCCSPSDCWGDSGDGALLAHDVLLEPLLQRELPPLLHLPLGLVLFKLLSIVFQGLFDNRIPEGRKEGLFSNWKIENRGQ
jgi:hypothetical protein